MKYGKEMTRRILSMLMVLVMCLGMLPVTALAADVGGMEENSGEAGIAVSLPDNRRFRMSVRSTSMQAASAVSDDYTLSISMPHGGGTYVGDVFVITPSKGYEYFLDVTLSVTRNGTSEAAPGKVRIKVPKQLECYRDSGYITGTLVSDYYNNAIWNVESKNGYCIFSNKNTLDGGTNLTDVIRYAFCPRFVEDKKIFPITVSLDGLAGMSVTQDVEMLTSVQSSVIVRTSGYSLYDGAATEYKYIEKYNSGFKTYFGLNASDFDFDNYIYELLSTDFRNRGTQLGRFKLDIIPGKYPTAGNVYYGYGGEILGSPAVMYGEQGYGNSMSGHSKYTGNFVKSSYLDDPDKFPDDFCLPEDATDQQKQWYMYTYEFPYEGQDDAAGSEYSYPEMCFRAVIRFPKTDSITNNHVPFDDATSMYLYANVGVTVTGLDSGTAFSQESGKLYEGHIGKEYYSGEIYKMDVESMSASGRSGDQLTDLRNGSDITVTASIDYDCFNVARGGYDKNSPSPYSLEYIFDNVMIDAGGKYYYLGDGDYEITDAKLSVSDSPGEIVKQVTNLNWGYKDWVINLDWTVPSASKASDAIGIYYGTSHDDVNDWAKVGQVALKDVWKSSTQQVFGGSSVPDGVTRFRAVYEKSEHITQAKMDITFTINTDGPTVKKMLEECPLVESANVYASASYRALGTTGENELSTTSPSSMWKPVDSANRYAGLSDDQYPYRDAMGKGITAAYYYTASFIDAWLYDRAGKQINTGVSDYPTVSGLSTITYTVGSGIFVRPGYFSIGGLSSNYTTMFSRARAFRNAVMGTGGLLDFAGQRFYVLLPDGLTWDSGNFVANGSSGSLVVNGLGKTSDGTRVSKYDDNRDISIPNETYPIFGYDGAYKPRDYFYQGVYRSAPGNATVTVDAGRYVDGRQLLEISVMYPVDCVDDYLKSFDMGSYVAAGLGTYLTIDCVYDGGNIAPSGVYDAQVASVFLDRDGNVLNVETVHNAGLASLCSESSSSRAFADYVGTYDKKTLLYNQTDVVNWADGAYTTSRMTIENQRISTVEPGSPYTYDLMYAIRSGTSTDVVLFANLETKGSGGGAPAWKGALQSIDVGELDVDVYVRREPFDVIAYRNGNMAADGLVSDGWELVTDAASYDYSGVTSLAFDFSRLEFYVNDSDKTPKTFSSATLHLNMLAPNDIEGGGVFDTVSELVFHDKHSSTNVAATTICNDVVARINIPIDDELNFELPKTGGTGTAPYAVTGFSTALLAGLLLLRRRRRG